MLSVKNVFFQKNSDCGMNNKKGKLISIEGISGAGKSSVFKNVQLAMKDLGYDTIFSGGYKKKKKKKQTGDGLEKFMIELIKKDPFIRLPWLSETHLLFAYLTLHIDKIIKPSLSEGKIIFYEHYLHSIKVYQLARAMEENILNEAEKVLEPMISYNNVELGIIEPNIHIYLETKPQIAIERYENREKCNLNNANKLFIRNTYNLYSDIISKKDYLIISNEDYIQDCVKNIVNIVISSINR